MRYLLTILIFIGLACIDTADVPTSQNVTTPGNNSSAYTYGMKYIQWIYADFYYSFVENAVVAVDNPNNAIQNMKTYQWRRNTFADEIYPIPHAGTFNWRQLLYVDPIDTRLINIYLMRYLNGTAVDSIGLGAGPYMDGSNEAFDWTLEYGWPQEGEAPVHNSTFTITRKNDNPPQTRYDFFLQIDRQSSSSIEDAAVAEFNADDEIEWQWVYKDITADYITILVWNAGEKGIFDMRVRHADQSDQSRILNIRLHKVVDGVTVSTQNYPSSPVFSGADVFEYAVNYEWNEQ